MKDLENKVALVTGSSRGLGRGIALELARQGANIIVNYNSSEKQAQEVVKKIQELNCQAIAIKADVSDEKSVEDMFGQIIHKFGHIDILVNNAGTTKAQDIFSTTLDDWNRIIKTNLTSCFLCSRAAMKEMAAKKSGRIVNISSIVARRGALYGHVHYAATKSGMFGFTKTLARTAAPFGITVNCVAPGIIGTELLFETHGAEEVEKLSSGVPLGLGKVEDVGLAVAYLCGPGGRYITGATIDVNGGMCFV